MSDAAEHLRMAVDHLDVAVTELERAADAASSDQVRGLCTRMGRMVDEMGATILELAINADVLDEVDDS